jgi:ketosteroid isomerase-like protein
MAEASENVQRLLEAGVEFNANVPAILAGERVQVPEVYSPDVVFTNFEPSPFPGTYQGYDGLHQWTRDLMGDFEDGQIQPLDFEEHGDRIAMKLEFRGTGHRSGIEAALVWGALFHFEEGRIVRADGYATYEEALERMRDREANA